MKNISNKELKELLAGAETVQVVDVRTKPEHEQLGIIPNALQIPLHLLPALHGQLHKEYPIVVTCEHGVRSVEACHYLEYAGYVNLMNLTMGMAEWDGERVFPSTELPA